MSVKGELIATIVGSVIVLGLPALVWGGAIQTKVELLAQQNADIRREIREDLKEIQRKLDKLSEAKPSEKAAP